MKIFLKMLWVTENKQAPKIKLYSVEIGYIAIIYLKVIEKKLNKFLQKHFSLNVKRVRAS